MEGPSASCLRARLVRASCHQNANLHLPGPFPLALPSIPSAWRPPPFQHNANTHPHLLRSSAGEQPWSTAHTPHSSTTRDSHAGAHVSLAPSHSPSMSGARQSVIGGPGSMSGLGPGGMLSRRPSCQIGHGGGELTSASRQSSIMSMVRVGVRGWCRVHHVGRCRQKLLLSREVLDNGSGREVCGSHSCISRS